MIQRSGQIFPLLLMALLAGLSFWLERIADVPASRRDGKLRHDPDTIVENFTLSRFNSEGFLHSRLRAPHMEHYPDDESSLIRSPHFTYYRQNIPETTITGEQARVTEKGDKVYLWGNVVAKRAASAERAATVARTDDLFLLTREGTGHTDSPVEITRGQSWMKGIGMDVNNNTSVFVLRSQVTGVLKKMEPKP